ncbi:MAG: cell division protein ZapE, partial [Betaproteobacteria bacterium]|nr:cell division protein ZapE [Betaproteobacteria bacterium]
MRDSALQVDVDGVDGEPDRDVVSRYASHLAKRGFVSDAAQWRAVERLQRLFEEWSAYKARRNSALKRL